MTTSTERVEGVIIVDGDATREEWMEARGEGVTASEINEIHNATITARRRILDRKLNGSTFKGNSHTRRGHEREAMLVDYAIAVIVDEDGWADANTALWASGDNDLFRATPDGIGRDVLGAPLGIEVKSLTKVPEKIDPSHYAQCQWGMRVLGAARWLYVFEVVDEDGVSLEDPSHVWIDRDDAYIAALEHSALQFIAWREAGAPMIDAMAADLAKANEAWVAAKRAADDAVKNEKTAAAALKRVAKKQPHAAYGVTRVGIHGGFQIQVTERTSIDEKAWAAAEPEQFADWREMKTAVEYLEAGAKQQFAKRTPSERLVLVESEVSK